MVKKFQSRSKYEEFDLNNDGIVDDQEIKRSQDMQTYGVGSFS
jgi:hypothetical protein